MPFLGCEKVIIIVAKICFIFVFKDLCDLGSGDLGRILEYTSLEDSHLFTLGIVFGTCDMRLFLFLCIF